MTKSKFVIIEGPDRCGKSTLTAAVAKALGPQTICSHSSSPPGCDNPFQWELTHYTHIVNALRVCNESSESAPVNFIADRFHLGVPVYGHRYRNYPESLTAGQIESDIFDQKILGNNIDVSLILVTDSIESIMSRDDGLSLESDNIEMMATRNAFIRQYNTSHLRKMHYQIQYSGFENLLPTVLKFLDL